MALTFHTDAAVDAADLAGPPQRFHAVVDRHFDADRRVSSRAASARTPRRTSRRRSS